MKARRNVLFATGIDKYKSSDFDNLNNSVIDAKAIINLLVSRYGFELFPEPLFDADATNEKILQGFNSLLMDMGPEDNLVVYFSGHGRQHIVGKQGYWVPYEANNRIDDFLPNSVVKDFIERIPAKHKFLIADSCFSGTFHTQTRSVGISRAYSDLDALNSRWMLASGGEETVSDGRPGEHSPFARYLIRFLTNNDNKHNSVKELIRYVVTMTENNSKQHPIGQPIDNIGHEGGQMIFTLHDHYVKTNKAQSKGLPHTKELQYEINAYDKRENKLPAGKEILLVESFAKEGEVLILEIFRFDDTGHKKLTLEDGLYKIEDVRGNQTGIPVIHRFATWQGFKRYWDVHEEEYKNRNPIMFGAHESIEKVEETEAVAEYSDYMQDLFDSTPDRFRCLHCGEMIATNDSSLIEIDEKGLVPAVGNVHNACLRPLDRIIGKAILANPMQNLISFDVEKWMELYKRGQFFWNNAVAAAKDKATSVVVWNREHILNTGEYCIKITLDDGRTKYVRLGREIQRFPADKIDAELAEMIEDWEKSNSNGDPVGYTSNKMIFGVTSYIQQHLDEGETIIHVVKMEKAKYSKQLETENKNFDNDYAPVGLVLAHNGPQILNFGNCIPLIFDPTQFESLHQNWNEVGYLIGPCSIKILESDREVDFYLQSFFEDEMQPIAHPRFDKNKELESGVYIQDIRYITKEEFRVKKESARSFILKENPEWKEGDRVRVIFSGPPRPKVPEGILLSDEFVDGDNESRVLFCPIENGEKLTQHTISVPTRLLERV
jgi:hypothetical protein